MINDDSRLAAHFIARINYMFNNFLEMSICKTWMLRARSCV